MTWFLLAVSLAVPLALGWGLVRGMTRGGAGLSLGLGAGLGLGLTGWLTYLGLAAGLTVHSWWLPSLELLLAGAAVIWGLRQPRPPSPRAPWSRSDKFLAWFLGLVAVMALIIFVVMTIDRPQGAFDAWWHWTSRARFIFRGDGRWTDYFLTEPRHFYIQDYPWMLSALIGRTWRWVTVETQAVPIAIAFGFTAATAVTVYAATARFTDRTQALLAATLLIGVPNFAQIGSYQLGDLPLCFFMLAAVVGMSLADSPDRSDARRGAVLAGLAAGLTLWSKNEAFVFVPALIAARIYALGRAGRWRDLGGEAVVFGLAIAPFVASIFHYRLTYAWSNIHTLDLTPGLIWSRAIDPGRHLLVISHLGQVLSPLLFIPIYLGLVGIRPGVWSQPGFKTGLLAIGLTLAGYYAVYLVQDPGWMEFRLINSKERLTMHLWPTTILLVFRLARTPILSRAGAAKRASLAPPKPEC